MARLTRLFKPFVWTSAGAAIAYLWDPENGRSRRVRLKDQLGGRARDLRGAAEQKARYVQSSAEGKLQAATSPINPEPEDDRTLVDKVKSEVLGAPEFANHQVVVDAVNGVVTLRGELPDAGVAKKLVSQVEKVRGVSSVENLLHQPGEAPPNKEPSLNAPGSA